MRTNFSLHGSTIARLACVAAMCSGSAASASTLRLFVTVGQVEAAFVAGQSLGSGNCRGGLVDCAIYGVGFGSDTLGVGSGAGGHGSSTGATSNGAPWGWAATQFGGPSGQNSAWEVTGTKSPFITLNGSVQGQTGYTANLGHASAVGMTPLKAGTTLAFMLTYDIAPAFGSDDIISLNILGVGLNPVTGAQVGNLLSGQIAVRGHINYDGSITASAIQAVPEPSTFELLSGAMTAILVIHRRLRGTFKAPEASSC